MCFISPDKNLYTAKEDILCYKHGIKLDDNTYRSSFKLVDYDKEMPEVDLVNDGDLSDGYINVEAGYHSYREEWHAVNNDWGERVAIFIIPKGSKYYKNYNQYVSNNIKFIEWL